MATVKSKAGPADQEQADLVQQLAEMLAEMERTQAERDEAVGELTRRDEEKRVALGYDLPKFIDQPEAERFMAWQGRIGPDKKPVVGPDQLMRVRLALSLIEKDPNIGPECPGWFLTFIRVSDKGKETGGNIRTDR